MEKRSPFEARLRAMLQALRFRDCDIRDVAEIASREPDLLLRLADRCQLTLPLAARHGRSLGDRVRARLERNLAANSLRHKRLMETHAEIIAALRSQDVEFCVLKGISHWPHYVDDPRNRPQYDIDLFCPPGHIHRAREALAGLGFEAAGRIDKATDHLPPMIRKTGWRWSGDYYDPEMPYSMELHHRFWCPEIEGIEIDRLQEFWARRRAYTIGPLTFPALDSVDALSYCTLHLLRHLFRGDLKAYHVYELAHFLERSSAASEFWNKWHNGTSLEFRQLQAIAFAFAMDWFGCAPHPAVEEARGRLPGSVQRWFDLFSLSPALALGRPNKNELLLHLGLIRDRRMRRKIVVRRLLPAPSARVAWDAHVRYDKTAARIHIRRIVSSALFVSGRAWHHIRVLPGLARAALRFRRTQTRMGLEQDSAYVPSKSL